MAINTARIPLLKTAIFKTSRDREAAIANVTMHVKYARARVVAGQSQRNLQLTRRNVLVARKFRRFFVD